MRLYVANFPFSTTVEELTALFEGAGYSVQDVSIVHDRETQKSRGFGFVEVADGAAAIAQLDGVMMGGRALKVNEALPRPERVRR